MLKKFFTVLLGSMAAIWLSVIIFGLIVLVAAIVWIASNSPAEIPEHSFLYLDLSGEIRDREQPSGLAEIVFEEMSDAPTFEEIILSLDKAKDDPKIDAVYLNLGDAMMSQALREELMEALKDFKSSGKKVIAYSDEMTQGDFYFASIADEVTLNPAGYIDFRGLSLTVPFFKGALDKLGVDIQVLKVGTFKSAVEPFIMTEMSEPNKLQYTELLNSIWGNYLGTVSSNLADRGVSHSVTALDSMASALTLFNATPSDLIANGFITTSDYRRQSELKLRQKGDDYELFETRRITPGQYLASSSTLGDVVKLSGDKPHIAILYAVGDIVDSGPGGIAGDRMVPLINKMAEDDNVKALVLRVNSGGGSAFASEQIWAALENFKKTGKPFYVSMGGTAASGGYYISAGADKIFADKSTITGSIGIFGIIPYAKELLNDKLGVTFGTVETNQNASFPRFDAPLTPVQHQALEDHVKKGYDLFLTRVANGRSMTKAQVDSIAQGRVWTGSKALELGLVDEIGSLRTAVSSIARTVSLNPSETISYPIIEKSPLERIVKEMNNVNVSPTPYTQLPQSTAEYLATRFGLSPEEFRKCFNILQRIKSMSTTQAKMEDITIE